MGKRVAILQSNYIPWKGYFDLIGMVDEFIFYDDMQYTRRDWRNRNKIKTKDGLLWLTIPVEQKGNYFSPINEIVISDKSWARKHWNSLRINYGKSTCFEKYADLFEGIYRESEKDDLLCQVNYRFIREINNILGITTKISYSSDYILVDGKTERLVSLCQQSGATEYISGPAAKDYIVGELFRDAGITLTWMDYSGYSEYPQLFGTFEHGVTVLDMIFNLGKDARAFMKVSRTEVE